MANYWGAMLTGMAQGYDNYQKTSDDLAYLRQSRANTLVQQDQANQLNQLKIQSEAQQMQLAEDTNSYYRQAAQPNDSGNALAATDNSQPTPAQQGQQAAQQPAPNAPAAQGRPQQLAQGGQSQYSLPQGSGDSTGVRPGTGTNGFKPIGKYTMEDYKKWDSAHGFAPGTSYALFATESSGNPDAVNPTSGAVGPGQMLPSTARNPGFGLKDNLDPRDPEAALGYFGVLLKKAGGDYNLARRLYLLGPNAKSPDTPEANAYVAKQNRFQSQYQAGLGADQAERMPSPAQQVQTAEDAGVRVGLPQVTQATDAQSQRIATLDRAAMNAAKAGNMQAATALASQADKLRGEQLDLQTKRNTLQKNANAEVSKLAAGVTDQSSYNNLQAQVQQNPAMQAAVAGLNLTGDFGADRSKIATLANRTLTLKDQEDIRLRRDDQQIKQAKERREQEQYDRQRVQEAQQQQAAQQQDEARRQQAAQSGMPYVPAMETSLPKGTAPAVVQKTRETNAKSWAQYDKDHENQRGGAERVAQLTTDMINRVTRNPDMVGGAWTTFRANNAPWALSQDQQVLLKDAETMVTEAQRSVSPGAQRSAATAAYAGILSKTKPNLSMGPQAFVEVANNFYYMNAAQKQMNEWVDKFREANPDATPTQATLLYRRYERSLGPSTYTDPKTHQQVPNSKSIPYLPNGQENPDYVSPESYFAHEGAK